MDTVRRSMAVRASMDLHAHARRPVQTQVLVSIPTQDCELTSTNTISLSLLYLYPLLLYV